MPRPRKTIPSVQLNLALREDIRARLDLLLYSPLEQRVPQGAYQQFFEALLLEYFNRKEPSCPTNPS